ncbi:MAG: hypothetical protein AB7E95_10270 [Kiritimatiellales bacterium]
MGLFATAKPVLVVDLDAVLKTKGVRGRAAPRQQLQILRSLSRFVQREKIKVTAVMAGSPLDKAPHNKVFEGVRVRYAKSAEVMGRELARALKQAGSAGVMVTEDAVLEKKVLSSGGTTLRLSTFRKLIDDGMDQSSGGGNNGGNSGGNNRQGGRRPRRKKNPHPQQQPNAAPKEEKENSGGNDAISQMIDLVD